VHKHFSLALHWLCWILICCQSMYLGLVIPRAIKTGASLKPSASLFLLFSPLSRPLPSPPPKKVSICRNWTAVLKWLQKWPEGTEHFSHPLHSRAPQSHSGLLPPLRRPPHSSARRLHSRSPRICDLSLQTTSSHLYFGFPICLVVLKFPYENFIFWWVGGDPFIFQSYNVTIFQPRLRFLNCLFPFSCTTSWTFARKEMAQILIRQMGKNI
jgi:hypothetical protein